MAQDVHTYMRRDKLDIILKILSIGNVPLKKTHILYQGGINYYQLTRYLDLLTRSGMIEKITEPFAGYRTTEKGRILLSLFEGTDDTSTAASERKPQSQTNHA